MSTCLHRTITTISLIIAPLSVKAQEVDLPPELVSGDPVSISLSNLPTARAVTIEALRRDADGQAYRSTATYRVRANGNIDLAADAPVSGDYARADAAGLFWSMRPTREVEPDLTRGEVIVRVRSGDAVIAQDSARLLDMARNVAVREVPEFAGARLYRPSGTRRLPIVILLGGSEGGSGFGRRMGPMLAARGYAALALPYYTPSYVSEKLPGLPTAFANIPVDRLEVVRTWLTTQPGLDPRRIGVYGVSKGAEFALLAASRYSWLRAVVAIVPSDVTWEGWGSDAPEGGSSSFSVNGHPLPFVPYVGMKDALAALYRGERRSLVTPHLDGRRASPAQAAAARIPIERYKGALLVAGGDRDQTWPSGEMVRAIAERRAAAGRSTVALSFADAGHGLSGTGWSPINFIGADEMVPANAAAQQTIHPAVLQLFARAMSTEARR